MSGSYIGKNPQYGFFEKQRITTANGVLTAFNLAFTTADSAQLLVSVAGVIQEPGQAYTVLSGTPQQISFTEAPATGVDIFIIWLGKELTGPRFSSAMLTDNAAITTLAATDDFLVYDADASALKKVQYQYVHSGVTDMAANTVKVRDANTTGAPSDKAVVDTQILIGDGTGFTAAALSGAITMTNAGVTSYTTQPAVLTGSTNNTIATVTAANAISGEANFTYDGTSVDIKNAGTASDIKLYCESSNAHYVSIKSPSHAGFTGGSWTLTLPGTNGLNGQALLSNGSGTTSWGSAGETWVIKTAAYTAVAGDGVMVDTDSAAITITLPVSGTLGDVVRIMDATGNCATTGRNITVARNSHNIQGAAADLTIATNRAAIGLVYVNATEGWVLIEN